MSPFRRWKTEYREGRTPRLQPHSELVAPGLYKASSQRGDPREVGSSQ